MARNIPSRGAPNKNIQNRAPKKDYIQNRAPNKDFKKMSDERISNL